MDLHNRLDSILEKWDLLKHPFYRAWSAGDLPVEKLRIYAEEYGAFVRTVPDGWQTVGDEVTAAEEHEHARLWDAFASCLGTYVGAPKLDETSELVQAANEAFSKPETALGGLYAFEAQQPTTARSKLDGLRLHYEVPAAGETYFELHADDDHEAEELLEGILALSPEDQSRAVAACESIASALWRGLDGVLGSDGAAKIAAS